MVIHITIAHLPVMFFFMVEFFAVHLGDVEVVFNEIDVFLSKRLQPCGQQASAGWPGLHQAGCVSTRNFEWKFCGVERSILFNVRTEVSCATHPA